MSEPLPSVVMTERADMPRNTTATTPGDTPNVKIKVMSAVALVGVRAARTFIQAFLAALVGVTVGPSVPIMSDVMPPSEFVERVVAAAYVGAVAAFIAAVWNGGELLARIDESRPQLRA